MYPKNIQHVKGWKKLPQKKPFSTAKLRSYIHRKMLHTEQNKLQFAAIYVEYIHS